VYAGADSARDSSTLCKTDDGSDVVGNKVRVMCDRPMLARYVSVALPGEQKPLYICEIYVTSGTLLASLMLSINMFYSMCDMNIKQIIS